MIRRIARATVWAQDAGTARGVDIARDVRRWVLPPLDALLLLGGVLGVVGGMPSLIVVYNPAVSHAAAILVVVSAAGSLLGAIIPRLWPVELAARCLLVFVLLTYALLLFGLATNGSEARGFIAGVTAASVVLPLWQIVWLGRDHRRRVALARAREGS